MAEHDLRVNDRLVIPGAELSWRFSTSSGPGGQHASRSQTRAEVRWNAAESSVLSEGQRRRIVARLGATVVAASDEERSQLRNRESARSRLRQRVAEALRESKKRRPTAPSRAARRRRMEDKQRRAVTKRQRRRPRYEE